MDTLMGALSGVGVLLAILLIMVAIVMIWIPLLLVRTLLNERTATDAPRNLPMPPSAFEAKHLGGVGYKAAILRKRINCDFSTLIATSGRYPKG